MTDLATRPADAIVERVIAAGDLARLSPEERTRYYGAVCESLGLNPLTQPFAYINLSGKLVLYATRGATDQLRRIHHVSTQILSRETVGDVYVVTAKATDRSGRSDESIGAVAIGGLKGEALCNALMKAETKAKRRATLAIVGLSFLDETEVETIPGARVHVEEPAPAALPAVELSPKAIAAMAEMQGAVAEDDDGAPVEMDGPVTEKTRLMCAAFADEVEAANPQLRVTLPEDRTTERGWLEWLIRQQGRWATSANNPKNAARPVPA